MKKTKKYLYIIAGLNLPALVMSAAEYVAKQSGLELRTFAQEIKGIYLWLVMPAGILCTANILVRLWIDEGKENPKALHMVRRILVVLLTLAILGVSFFRGIFYAFTDEMVEEERMPDGYLAGTWSGFLSESHVTYYEVVAGIFRKPFQGWDRQQLTQKVQELYGAEAEYVEQQPGGWHVFRLPDRVADGEFIYFHVSDSYKMRNNGFYQMMLSEAEHFWKNRNRYVTLGSGGGISFEEAMDTGEELEELPTEPSLYITCYDTGDDISACAADLTDWLLFVKNTGEDSDESLSVRTGAVSDYLPTHVQVGSGNDYFRFGMSSAVDAAGNETWEEQYRRMKESLSAAFGEHRENQEAYAELLREREKAHAEEAETGNLQETAEQNFMDTYDGSFEKECQVGDGRIRYRMVVEDAALGSRFYGLLKSLDGGESWQMSNPDPFDQQLGQGIDFTFLNEQVGFATLMHNGGDEADLYVTKDGGESYQRVVMEGYTVSLEDGFTYNPYDYPQMPYVEDMPYKEGSVIYVFCGQGADGDYNGGDRAGLALYQSTDEGYTFSFVRIQKPEEEG